MLAKWTPADVIAIILVTGGMTIVGLGRDGTASAILTAIAGAYFGVKLQSALTKGKNG